MVLPSVMSPGFYSAMHKKQVKISWELWERSCPLATPSSRSLSGLRVSWALWRHVSIDMFIEDAPQQFTPNVVCIPFSSFP